MKISVVIVTFNRLAKLKKAVASVINQEIYQVIVVNNNSSDGTFEWLEEEKSNHKNLTVINLEKNTGGAGGFYYGVKFVVENTDADWVLLYDDDAYPQENLITNFQKKQFDDRVGAVNCLVCMPDGRIADFNRPGLNPFVSLAAFGRYLFSGLYLTHDQLKSKSALSVDFSSFVGLFVRVSLIKSQLGYPEKDFFIYCDDWLYTLKLSQLGFKNLFFSDLIFYHDSKTFVDSYDEQLWKKYYAYRNSIYFYKVAAKIFSPLVIFLKLIQWVISVKNYKNKLEYFKTLFRAIKDGFVYQEKQC